MIKGRLIMTKTDILEKYREKIIEKYVLKRPRSERMYREAKNYLPGGDTRSVTFFQPFSTYMARGEGCLLHDVDGNLYIDFGNNQTSLVHGHAHPKIVEAVINQVKLGSAVSAPVEKQIRLGEIICRRLRSAEKVRFCNSGTEATLGAIRLARAYRKKYKLVKIEGGYHGSHDLVEISVKPPLENAGLINKPNSVPEDVSISPNVVKDCIVIPFNSPEAAQKIISENHSELGAVIVEPVLGSGGMLPATTEYLQTLRDVTLKYRIPLIFDEVYTFRLAEGGYQGLLNIIPDITALGKIIGGGYPVGAIAGRDEFMDLFSPLNKNCLTHSGTFNGNPVTVAAGAAALTELTGSEIDRINQLGDALRNKFKKVLEEVAIVGQVTGTGSLVQIHFTKEEVKDYRSAATARVDIRSLLFLMLMDKGIFPAARCMFNISTPMDNKEIEQASTALRDCLFELRPFLEKNAPELLTSR
jgi:glutamate-1-semialdehyde 2,1-aminomutase